MCVLWDRGRAKVLSRRSGRRKMAVGCIKGLTKASRKGMLLTGRGIIDITSLHKSCGSSSLGAIRVLGAYATCRTTSRLPICQSHATIPSGDNKHSYSYSHSDNIPEWLQSRKPSVSALPMSETPLINRSNSAPERQSTELLPSHSQRECRSCSIHRHHFSGEPRPLGHNQESSNSHHGRSRPRSAQLR
jgi:hypothetical protein